MARSAEHPAPCQHEPGQQTASARRRSATGSVAARVRRRNGWSPLAAVGVVGLVLTGCSNASTSDAGAAGPASGTSSAASVPGTVACSYPVGGSPSKAVDPPATSAVPATGTTTATMTLGDGKVTLTLDRGRTPCTVNSFLSLAKQGWFDATKCHRLTTQGIFVLQCGDPTGTGSGGPGYSFADELSGSEKYTKGTVAMANAGANTNGSQFFLVYEDSPLPAAYTVFGHMDAAGLADVQKIADAGTASGNGDGAPAADATIHRVTLG